MASRQKNKANRSTSEETQAPEAPTRGLPWAWICVAVIAGFVVAQILPFRMFPANETSGSPNSRPQAYLKQARAYENDSQWNEAVATYERIAADLSFSDQARSEAAERAAEIYFEELKDSQAARRAYENAAFQTGLPSRKNALKKKARDLPRLPAPAPAEAPMRTPPEGHAVIARVGTSPVTIEDIAYAWEKSRKGEPITAEALPEFIDSYMNTVLLAQHARNLEFDENDKYLQEVMLFENQLLSKAVQETIKARPTEDEIAIYYREHADDFLEPPAVKLQHIVVREEAESEQIGIRLENGEDFEYVGQSMSLDREQLENGVDLGWITEGTGFIPYLGAVPALADRMLRRADGFTTGPIETARGLHWIRVAEKKGEQPKPLASVRREVERSVAIENFKRLQNELIVQLKQTMETSVDAEALRAAIQRATRPDPQSTGNPAFMGPAQSIPGGGP